MSATEAAKLLADAKARADTDPDKALAAATEAEKMFNSLGFKTGAVDAFRLMVSATLAKGECDNAMQMASKKLDAAKGSGDVSMEAYMLLTVAEANLYLDELATGLQQAKAARAIFTEAGDSKGEAKAALVEATAYTYTGEMEVAVKIATQAAALAQKALDTEGQAQAMHLVANAKVMGGMQGAVEPMKKALSLYRELKDRKSEASVLVAMGSVQVGDVPDEALKSAKDAMGIFASLAMPKGESEAMMVLVKAQIALGDEEEALTTVKDKLASCDAPTELLFTPVLINAYLECEKPDDALSAATTALEAARAGGDASTEGWMLCSVAEARMAKKDYKEAEEMALQACSKFQEAGDKPGEAAACATLTKVYTMKGEAYKAPNRVKGIELLGKLTQAVNSLNKKAFDEVFNQMYMTMGVDKQDLEASLQPVFKKNPAAQEFWTENAYGFFAISGSKRPTKKWAPGDGTSHLCYAKSFDRIMMFAGQRWGSMGYGPSFRSVQCAYRNGAEYHPGNGSAALSVIQDQTLDVWEEVALFQAHPGVMDAALQVQGIPYATNNAFGPD
jgi:tetratricopeptide (TPR) repeat protein